MRDTMHLHIMGILTLGADQDFSGDSVTLVQRLRKLLSFRNFVTGTPELNWPTASFGVKRYKYPLYPSFIALLT
jgi:hypothetical protein